MEDLTNLVLQLNAVQPMPYHHVNIHGVVLNPWKPFVFNHAKGQAEIRVAVTKCGTWLHSSSVMTNQAGSSGPVSVNSYMYGRWLTDPTVVIGVASLKDALYIEWQSIEKFFAREGEKFPALQNQASKKFQELINQSETCLVRKLSPLLPH